eukprot:CAMPEP_0174236666 /NCGR_PEP_ID=MMETSP0417-20130205/5726_1 /TAXON_ID=242541 /ORGANISM="Mayorella sp, Strain BSH-02190019" /LENGTH=223 /DNA_ID=CAMNT_0015315337 /DNA_START=97 /DNA_END=764 /DNA_ORIENTATION=-
MAPTQKTGAQRMRVDRPTQAQVARQRAQTIHKHAASGTSSGSGNGGVKKLKGHHGTASSTQQRVLRDATNSTHRATTGKTSTLKSVVGVKSTVAKGVKALSSSKGEKRHKATGASSCSSAAADGSTSNGAGAVGRKRKITGATSAAATPPSSSSLSSTDAECTTGGGTSGRSSSKLTRKSGDPTEDEVQASGSATTTTTAGDGEEEVRRCWTLDDFEVGGKLG